MGNNTNPRGLSRISLHDRIAFRSTDNDTAIATQEPGAVLLEVGAMPGSAFYQECIERLEQELTTPGIHHVTVGSPHGGCRPASVYDAASSLRSTSGTVTTIICSYGHWEESGHCLQLRGPQDDLHAKLTSDIVHLITQGLGETRINDVCFATPRSDVAVLSAESLPKDSVALSLAPRNGPHWLYYLHLLSKHAGESDWSIDGLRRAVQAHDTDHDVEVTMRKSTGETLTRQLPPCEHEASEAASPNEQA